MSKHNNNGLKSLIQPSRRLLTSSIIFTIGCIIVLMMIEQSAFAFRSKLIDPQQTVSFRNNSTSPVQLVLWFGHGSSWTMLYVKHYVHPGELVQLGTYDKEGGVDFPPVYWYQLRVQKEGVYYSVVFRYYNGYKDIMEYLPPDRKLNTNWRNVSECPIHFTYHAQFYE